MAGSVGKGVVGALSDIGVGSITGAVVVGSGFGGITFFGRGGGLESAVCGGGWASPAGTVVGVADSGPAGSVGVDFSSAGTVEGDSSHVGDSRPARGPAGTLVVVGDSSHVGGTSSTGGLARTGD